MTEQLVREGKVLYVGSSHFAGWHIARANEQANARHFLGLVSEQSLYNLNARMIELEVIPACCAYGLGIILWSPLGGGLLVGAFIIKTTIVDEQVVGYVSSYEEAGKPEVTYGIGKEYWGKGLATRALSEFLGHVTMTRPIYARVAKDNIGSLRVLHKCGFTITGEDTGFANARSQDVEAYLLTLHA